MHNGQILLYTLSTFRNTLYLPSNYTSLFYFLHRVLNTAGSRIRLRAFDSEKMKLAATRVSPQFLVSPEKSEFDLSSELVLLHMHTGE